MSFQQCQNRHIGQTIGLKTKKLLGWLGVDDKTIRQMNLDSIRNKKFTDIAADRNRERLMTDEIHFSTQTLPASARPITLQDTRYIEYLADRGLSPTDYSFKITPNEKGRLKNRIIIPYMYSGRVVGWTSRFMDDFKPKYLNEHQQAGYIFGTDMQSKDWEYAIVSEGILDAVSINGLAVLHGEITETQLSYLRRLDKEIIVVIDQDKPGLYLAELAIKAGFAVSVPNWGLNDNGEPIHDINEAVQKYGKVATVLSIIHARETSKIKITVALNKMKKRMKIK